MLELLGLIAGGVFRLLPEVLKIFSARPHTFFHLDPPYWQTEGYGVPFPFSEYQAMAEAMRGLKGKALLSINDHPDIRTCFAGLDMEGVEIGYQVGGGTPVVRKELVVWSWDRAAEPAGLF